MRIESDERPLYFYREDPPYNSLSILSHRSVCTRSCYHIEKLLWKGTRSSLGFAQTPTPAQGERDREVLRARPWSILDRICWLDLISKWELSFLVATARTCISQGCAAALRPAGDGDWRLGCNHMHIVQWSRETSTSDWARDACWVTFVQSLYETWTHREIP